MFLKRMINYSAALIALIIIYPGQPAFSQPTRDCQATIKAWQADVSLKQYLSKRKSCYCPSPTSIPVCPPKTTTRGAATSPMGGDFAMQVFGGLFSSMLQGIFAPPRQDTAYQQQLMQQQMEEQKRQEAIKKQAMEHWNKFREEEKALMEQNEAQKKKRGQELLARMDRTGGGKLKPFSLVTPRLEFTPIGAGVFDTSGYTSWQRLLCSAYFSSKALYAARSGNPEEAVFMNAQADKVTVGAMTEVECQLPGLQQLADIQRQNLKENNRMAQMVKLLPIAQEKVRHLQQIEMKLRKAKEEKKEAGVKLKEAENKVAEARVQAESAKTPEGKSEADDLLAQALALQDEASGQIEKAEQAEREYAQMKKNELNDIKAMEQEVKQKFKDDWDEGG